MYGNEPNRRRSSCAASPKNPEAGLCFVSDGFLLAVAAGFARCATFAKVVGGRRYGRTVGTTVAPARSTAAAVTMLIAPCWTPVPGPKSIR
jgi:hypothetical protein